MNKVWKTPIITQLSKHTITTGLGSFARAECYTIYDCNFVYGSTGSLCQSSFLNGTIYCFDSWDQTNMTAQGTYCRTINTRTLSAPCS